MKSKVLSGKKIFFKKTIISSATYQKFGAVTLDCATQNSFQI